MAEAARVLLMYVGFPLWVGAGLTDWFCHRCTAIERTSGPKENLLHFLMSAEVGVAMLAVALLEVNAAVLLLVLLAFVVHEMTVYWDLHYSTPLRRVGPFEQMVHSFPEILPLLSLSLPVAAGQRDEGRAVRLRPCGRRLLVAAQSRPAADWLTDWRDADGAASDGIPLLEETWRCPKARR